MAVKRLVRVCVCATLLVFTSWIGELRPAVAADPVALAQEAVQKSDAGDHMAALRSIEGAYMAIWDRIPLGFKRYLFVSERATGYGVFKPRTNALFKNGEILRVYVEPVGYAFQAQSNMFTWLITVDFNLRTKAGKVLGGQKEFGRFEFTSHERNTEYFMNLTFNFSGAPKGEYVLETILQDKISGKLARFELPFQIE